MTASFLYNEWLKSGSILASDLAALNRMSHLRIADSFKSVVRFGKAGFRSRVGLGSAFFNRYTIQQIVFAISRAIVKWEGKELKGQSFIVLHDTRATSTKTSRFICELLSSLGVKVYTVPGNDFCPTPFLSFLLMQERADFGFIVTASHQDKSFNGLKFFYRQKGVVNEQLGDEINLQIEKNHLVFLKRKWIANQSLIRLFDWEKSQKKYFEIIEKNLSFNKPNQRQISIVYSPLHGTGAGWTDKLLRESGYDVNVVESQNVFDGKFATVKDPNPESNPTFDLAIELAKKQDADLIICNDPDADRMRFACRVSRRKYQLFSGNEIATIFIYFMLAKKKKSGTIFKTFVSSDLINEIASDFNCNLVTTLTGFANLAAKYIKSKDFVFAFEESLGFLPDKRITNDKDGIQAAFLIAEIANFLRREDKKTISEFLKSIYSQYGFFRYDNYRIKINGNDHLKLVHKSIRRLTAIDNFKIKQMTIFFNEKQNNLYKITLEKGSWISCRRSITEPIFKFYFTTQNKNEKDAKINIEALKKSWIKFLKRIENVSEL